MCSVTCGCTGNSNTAYVPYAVPSRNTEGTKCSTTSVSTVVRVKCGSPAAVDQPYSPESMHTAQARAKPAAFLRRFRTCLGRCGTDCNRLLRSLGCCTVQHILIVWHLGSLYLAEPVKRISLFSTAAQQQACQVFQTAAATPPTVTARKAILKSSSHQPAGRGLCLLLTVLVLLPVLLHLLAAVLPQVGGLAGVQDLDRLGL
jgi:hypothetical protein